MSGTKTARGLAEKWLEGITLDMHEALVEAYLTIVEGCAVIPQVPILKNRKGEDWYAFPDFLAFDFNRRETQPVEVTKGGDPWKIIERRNAEREEIEHYVRLRLPAGKRAAGRLRSEAPKS